jgi:hypothetical protein
MPHDGHEMHLCYLANLGYQTQGTKEYKALVRDGRFMCQVCGRVAAEKKNLCRPVEIV